MGKTSKKQKMNLILQAFSAETKLIREFHVSFYENKAVIFEYDKEHESYLSNLVKGIIRMSNSETEVFCVSSEMFAEMENIKKIKILEDYKIELIEPKVLNLTEAEKPV